MSVSSPSVIVLGTAQDGGYPQAGCKASCCNDSESRKIGPLHPSSLAICDPGTGLRWIIDCTPSFPRQLALLDGLFPGSGLPGFLLTHAHMGHYTGLVHLGREVLNASGVEVYTLGRMKEYLEKNLPWKELVDDGNIRLIRLHAEGPGMKLNLSPKLSVVPRLVPHRDEHSETACFQVDGPNRSVLWLPDVDAWEGMDPSIEELIGGVDIAFLDGSFFDPTELPARDMNTIAHPCMKSSIARFSKLPAAERGKIRFIHLNHSNPAIDPNSEAAARVAQAGHSIARQGDLIEL